MEEKVIANLAFSSTKDAETFFSLPIVREKRMIYWPISPLSFTIVFFTEKDYKELLLYYKMAFKN